MTGVQTCALPISHLLKNFPVCCDPHSQRTSLVAQKVKSLPAMLETWVQSLGWEDPLHSETWENLESVLGKKEEPGLEFGEN